MGYDTDFEGRFSLDRPLTAEYKRALEDLYEDEHTPGEDGKPNGFQCYYCQWIANEDWMSIEWDGGEKFYCYVEWLEYLIDQCLKPWGYVLNGAVLWQGEGGATWQGQEIPDRGTLYVRDNQVEAVLDGTAELSDASPDLLEARAILSARQQQRRLSGEADED